MNVSKCSAQLLERLTHLRQLPEEILEILHRGSGSQYLDILSQLTLDPTYTAAIFTTHEPVFVEICSRWLSNPETESLAALAAMAKILPSAPHLSVYAGYLLDRRRGLLEALTSQETTALQEMPTETLRTLLLALCRLLMFDNGAFASAISPAKLQVLLIHVQPHIRYLAIRIMCLYLHGSDAALMSMIKSYIGEDEISGQWEDKTIDYSFFSLWERKRLKDLGRVLQHSEDARGVDGPETMIVPERVLAVEELSPTTACIGGVLIPRLDEKDPRPSSLVMTKTSRSNIRSLADAVNLSRPILVTGCSGAGKTSAVRDVARELGKSASMVNLHLNGQTDAKLLIGVYTSAKMPGSFSWSPGVLTTAVKEGRWLVIEDLDRAPTEIISTLLPLLERRELFVPNWGESIKAAPGFKLIATVRSTMNAQGEEVIPTAGMLGTRHWLHVPLKMPSDKEYSQIVINRCPLLHAYMPRFMDVYKTVRYPSFHNASKRTSSANISKPFGPQDLLRWCGRVQDLLSSAGIVFGNEPISDALNDHIFLEAIDCFVRAYALGSQRADRTDLIAEGLHMPTERATYCLEARKAEYLMTDSTLRIGRATLVKRSKALGAKASSDRLENSPFATTKHVTRIMESIAVAVKQAEPCLLVGETGTGKTTVVQRLADALNQKLTVVNLSQQSEAGDLLGGYKPVNMRVLAVPMKEEFDELLEMTFTSKRNQRYIETLGKSISKGRWTRALVLWQEALRMMEGRFKLTGDKNSVSNEEPLYKKRKLESSKLQKLKLRWDKFAADVSTFQKHLASGSKGFAFSFVEGSIVKAARNGEWVLLDEINLAAPDTLESLADLLSHTIDGGPSIQLTESGDAQRIYAHKDFRIFGAMNPATDIGKRDLPMGLRSRFTELYIEAPDTHLEDLVPVVQAYLGRNQVDVRAATDVAQLYLEIKKLADGNQLVDGANQKPHSSLRTLTRTLVYALNIAPLYGLRRALFEGFSMSFLTSLDRKSELLLQPLIDKHILAGQKNSRALLHRTPHPPNDGRNHIQFKHYWILRGAHPTEEQAHYIITPFIERNLLNLVRATSTRKFPILLQGPTSSGKTSMVEYLARISGNKYIRINNHEHTDLQEYLGSYVSDSDGRLKYQEGILVQALRKGYWVVLDELNLAPTDVLEALNRLLDDNRELLITETQQVVRPHSDFMLFATQNPPGMYGGRKVLSRAFRNRFLELHFDDIPEDELETILRERSQIAPSFCNKIVKVYRELTKLRQSERLFEQKNSFATLRDLFRWASREAHFQEQLAINGFLLLAERVRKQEERSMVKKVVEDVMKVKIDESQLYSVAKTENTSSLGIVWTRSMRRLYTLVTEALKNNEPVLLIGETGSGKTTICQFVAEMTNTHLHIVNAHQNMETSDLIGAQRPIRNKALAESQLAQVLRTILRECEVYREDNEHDLPALLEAYAVLQRQAPATLSDEMRLRVEQSKIRANSLFEWADGSLVNAMRNGHHFLLDEISLADDSVLERLNSVLEPGRTLFLAEKGTDDDPVQATPGFQFLATMNPGGDYGKRELTGALRNRFTEIWVPSASSEEELLEIVQAKLDSQNSSFAKPMVAFAAWYSATYNAAAQHISIRDLLSWVQFANAFQDSDAKVGLLNGAALVYVDGLGANPASKLSISKSFVLAERGKCLSKLEELFGQGCSSLCNQNYRLRFTRETFSIGPFSLAKAAGSQMDPRYSLQAPTTTANAMKITRALQLNKPILVEGSPGVGKTTLVAALAQAIGMPLTRINLSDQTDLMDLFGSDVPVVGADAGNFIWHDAPFLRAMQKGEWVLLDEMNLASQSVLEGLNACLDHRGQVYVSELDQTFEKHPNFVVFAAQNPHHQGGGRKGLPASFVNRFTVIYADNFNAEDLMIISSDMFPNTSLDDREKILHSVTALTQALQDNCRIGADGGPWEINLRDMLRWLHLLTSDIGLLPFAGAADFQQLLFLQRFRTFEDVAAVSKVLQQYIPRNRSRTYFHGKCCSLLEIGLGVLPRDLKLQPIQDSQTPKMDLEIAESVVLCVQNQWPCLLVGGPGSGKSSMILQLATTVGADVVEISLNSEMDTLDLVGGYEQMDPQRAVVDFVRRLHGIARSDLIANLTSANGFGDCLAALESKVRHPAVNLAEVLGLIRTVADEDRGSKYKDFVIECEQLTALGTNDNRARFEWVDGMLVKALKRGQWVILDNANLCSPSVLDRLNSLLEPDGFLSINEHRHADGSAKIVKPHKGFRLFMTMDPRHGELSRAMRNRSIELFMPAQPQSPLINALGLDCESPVFRFALFQAFDWNRMDETRFSRIISICFDHLTFLDLNIDDRWMAQIMDGLSGLTRSKQLLFAKIAKTYQMVSDVESPMFKAIRDTYQQLGARLPSSAPGFESMQTIHPFNNPILLSATDRNPTSSNLRWLGGRFDLLVDTHGLIQELTVVDESIYSKDQSSWSRLERSMIFLRTGKFYSDTTQPLASFLRDMASYLRNTMEGEVQHGVVGREVSAPRTPAVDSNSQCSQRNISIPWNVLDYLKDVFNLAHSANFDEGVFQVYQTLGRSLCAQARPLGSPTSDLLCELNTKLDAFNPSWQLSSGLGMEMLWTALRPATARDLRQLEFSMLVKELADRFDAVKWSSGASVRELEALQISIVHIHDFIGITSFPNLGPLDDIQKTLEDLESRSALTQVESSPYFKAAFEVLCQYDACQDLETSTSRSMLTLLAGRPAALSMRFGVSSAAWKALSQLNNMTAMGHPDTELGVIRGMLVVSLLQKLEGTSEVPLQSLELLCTEMDSVARELATSMGAIQHKPLDHLYHILRRLRIVIQQALGSQDHEYKIGDIQLHMDQLHQRFGANHDDKISTVEKTQHLLLCIAETMSPQTFDALPAPSEHREDFLGAALQCVQYFTGCLLLYVPDRRFDPALRPIVSRIRHNKRKAELDSGIQALRDFEHVFSGQTSSFRLQLAEQNLESLGAEPEVPSIVRPHATELGQLQAEFNNILSTIVLRSPGSSMLHSVYEGQLPQVQEVKLLRANIAQGVLRLSKSFHTYDDVTKPLVAMLQGLDAGLALALLAGSQKGLGSDDIKYLCDTTPFLGGGPYDISNVTPSDLQKRDTDKVDRRLQFLDRIAVARSVRHGLGAASVDTMFQAFHSLYEEWKERLGWAQQQFATNSSVYRYRGSAEQSDEADEQDFRHLFPLYDRPSEDGTEQTNAGKTDPREQARRLAQVQREIFHNTQSTSEGLLRLLRHTSQDIVKLWQDRSNVSTSPVPPATLLPALVLSLYETRDHLYRRNVQGHLYNFYTDANLAEAQKLVVLVRRIQTRFGSLQEAWPEHATLGEVLKTSSELLTLRHTEPIAKLLTKTEQLHGYVYEWQVVASKQYTALTLYDQLTELLVSWRRLELSTWARLLDMEDQRCLDDADAWWFVAYEVIIAAPLSIIHAKEDVYRHTEHLFSTLAEFMTTTSVGQYTRRLGMISCFKGHLHHLMKDFPSMDVVHNAITNFLSYYTRFEASIQGALRKGRQPLEKDMKDILLLASWKDTNINALRDSAKRSHHKLFKVVRIYRTLLAQSAEKIIGQGIPIKANLPAPSISSVIPAELVDPRALQVCQQHSPKWQTKQERFTKPTSTAARMLRMSLPFFVVFDPAPYLDSFGVDLMDSIKDLQKETPSKITKENSEFIKHLKARKRKLFADTLKSLRQMGFQSNMSADALAKQASTASILTHNPDFGDRWHLSDSHAAEYHFHKLLSLMPQVKERARGHTEDLTHGEISRSLGYLESMVAVILRQRTFLACTGANLDAFEEKIKIVKDLWDPDSYTLKHQDRSRATPVSEIRYILKWLPSILETSSFIIEKHSEMGGTDLSTVLQSLEYWKGKIAASVKVIDNLTEVSLDSLGLTSSRYDRVLAEAKTSIEDFKANLQEMMTGHPELGYILRQIELWTNPKEGASERYVNGAQPSNLNAFDDAMSVLVDSILVAIQRMQDSIAAMPTSDDIAWLVHTDACQGGSLKKLHVAEVNKSLDDAISMIRQLESVEESHLNVAGAICAMALPIVEQFHNIYEAALHRHLKFHGSLCKFSALLAHSFAEIALDGFCSPAENSAAESGETEKFDGGTGLGEGEGAEDISKDVQDDEDLSELAQGQDIDKERGEIEDQEDAVDMNHDEMEGEMGEGSDKGEEGGSANEGDEDDIDEETGSVDDLDPTAVDEKLWEGKAEDTEKEKEGSKLKGETKKDEQVAADSATQRSKQMEEKDVESDEIQGEGMDEDEEVAKEETEKMDPHAQEGQNLDLPEEMELDNMDSSEAGSESATSDMDGMSDIEQEQANEVMADQQDGDDEDDQSAETQEASYAKPDDPEKIETEAGNPEAAGSPVDTEPTDDGEEEDEDNQGLLHDRPDDAAVDLDHAAPSDVRGLNGDIEQEQNDEQASTSQAQASNGTKGSASDKDGPEAAAKDGQLGPSRDRPEGGQIEDGQQGDSTASEAFKKLGDALEKWHRQNSQIREATEEEVKAQPDARDVDSADQEFEHLQNEEADGNTQALGAATDEQARALDEIAMDFELRGETHDFPPNQAREEGATGRNEPIEDVLDSIMEGAEDQAEQSRPSTFVNNNHDRSWGPDQANTTGISNDEDIEDLDNDFSTTHLQSSDEHSARSAEEARRLWAHYESLTRDLSLSLTEQLRLILAPTLATKMRGDFRTGKRLNMKRIIPYIASQYKRDKIWMRRSIPSKRNYQIMLAVDDSKSMGESGSGRLAFETLALVAKSLSMLEVGEICVVRFGNDVHVAHAFDKPFSPEAGAQIFQHFGFQQTKTNVCKLVAESIGLFRTARRKSFNAGTDLWQLELIVSDGVCEDHGTIRRLVRQAQEEHIMIVFVIVDALLKGESIMEMKQAIFSEGGDIQMKRYLDGFPFPYYLVVGDMKELPGVLAQALRQWFSEVVESAGAKV